MSAGQRVHRWQVLSVVAGLVTWAATAWAVVVPLQLSELVAQSDVVVRGHVTGLESSFSADGSTIRTDVTLHIIDLLRSRLEPTETESITFRVEGGAVGDEEVRISIAPAFAENDEGLFFLQMSDDGEHLTLVGQSQGFLQIDNGMVRVEGRTEIVETVISEVRDH
jgi:hypothetical protein